MPNISGSTENCDGRHKKEWPPESWFRTKDFKNADGEKICAIEFIGQGGFGEVFKGHRRFIKSESNYSLPCVNESLAIKVLPYNEFTENLKKSSSAAASELTSSKNPCPRVKREVDVHEKLRTSENVVKPIKIFKWPIKSPKEVLLCMEYCPFGDLEKFLKRRHFTEALAFKVVIQVVKGLLDLKKIGYFHRDVKASNVFVTGGDEFNPTFKLGDFGLVADIKEINTMVCGTPSAMAPEMRGGEFQAYNEKVDIWSLGILLFTKLLKRHPYNVDFSKLKTAERVRIQNQGWNFPQDCSLSTAMKELLRNMLDLNPYLRISLEQIEPKIQEWMRFHSQSDSGFMTSSQISANTTNQLKASMVIIIHLCFFSGQTLRILPKIF